MLKTIGAVLAVSLACCGALAEESPYAGQETRAIKALSEAEIAGCRAGKGMGFAMAAELNGYPGPKHVLELAAELDLEQAQLGTVRQEFDRMHQTAERLGSALLAKETELDAVFAGGQADEQAVEELVAGIGRIRAELRYAHLRAHLATHRVLSSEQRARYAELRGYHSGMKHGHGQHHPGH